MAPVPLRSPVARAVVPVLGGMALLAAVFGVTWAVALWMSRGGADPSERFVPSTFRVGRVEAVSDEIAESGPLLFPNLDSSTAGRTVVLDHTGGDPTRGWSASWAYPADAGSTCPVEQVEGTDRFVDCDGREVGVDDLARDPGLCPIVEERETISLGLRPEACGRR